MALKLLGRKAGSLENPAKVNFFTVVVSIDVGGKTLRLRVTVNNLVIDG